MGPKRRRTVTSSLTVENVADSADHTGTRERENEMYCAGLWWDVRLTESGRVSDAVQLLAEHDFSQRWAAGDFREKDETYPQYLLRTGSFSDLRVTCGSKEYKLHCMVVLFQSGALEQNYKAQLEHAKVRKNHQFGIFGIG